MYKAKCNCDEGIFQGIKNIGDNITLGYEKIDTFFVDNSGFGSESEPALTARRFLNEVKKDFYYAITDMGQFQVYIGEFKKVNKSRKEFYKDLGIIYTKLVKNNTRLTIYINGKKVLRLHNTDIITWQDDKIILNNGGWDTATTRARFNEFLPDYIHIYRDKGITYISYNNQKIKYQNGIELQA